MNFYYEELKEVQDLLSRSHRLGSDPKNTNYAGGNASCKATVEDPVGGGKAEVMWVKGSGGDLGTLAFDGLAALRVDALRALRDVYEGVEHEDEMVHAFDFCLFGKGGAAPSIDTAMHGLLSSAHVDHLHPDAGIAIATARDGEALTKEIFHGKVAWIPWRRPGFQLGLEISEVQRKNKELIGVILGGHGITAWGEDSDSCEGNSLEIISLAQRYIETHGRKDPFGAKLKRFDRLPLLKRRQRAYELFPFIRGLASTDIRQIGHFKDDDVVLEFLESERHVELARRGSSCPDHFLRTKVRPMVLEVDSDASLQEMKDGLAEAHQKYRQEYMSYYNTYATSDSPPMRGADPAVVLVPGVGMFTFGKDAQTARVAGEFYVNAINVMRGAEAISVYEPIPEEEKFRIEYWQLEEDKLKRLPPPKPLSGKIAVITGGGSGIGASTSKRLAREGAHVVVLDLDGESAKKVAADIGSSDKAVGFEVDVSSRDSIEQSLKAAVLVFGGVDIVINNAGLSLSRSLFETTEEDWDLQYSVMPKGSFMVSKSCAQVMVEQNLGGDIVYVVSKNGVFAGPNNLAYGSAKASQAHQVRLLAAELGAFGIRVNGVNPDGVVKGSKIFSSGWGAQRAAVYGVPEESLGAYYAQRTLLKQEVTPDHIASSIFVLVGGDLSLTTGTHIPVDSGVAAAFLR